MRFRFSESGVVYSRSGEKRAGSVVGTPAKPVAEQKAR
jgi:hypothetical protein